MVFDVTRASKIAAVTLLTVASASDQDFCAGKPDYTVCDDGDGNPQTISFCRAEVCTPFDLCGGVTCTPLNDCHTAGVCDSATGLCSTPQKPNFSSCDDGNPVTTYDICANGVCVGHENEVDTLTPTAEPTQEPTLNPTLQPTPDKCDGVICVAQSQCHEVGVCDSATGECSNPFKPYWTLCDDGNPVTQLDHCDGAGVCSGTDFCENVSCPPLDDCHLEGVCNPKNGLCSTPEKENFELCDDGNPDTPYDPTTEPTSEPTPVPTSEPSQSPTTDPTADPTQSPTMPDLCLGVSCPAQSECHLEGVCDPATGACTLRFQPYWKLCDDGNPNTLFDSCDGAGTCTGMDLCESITCSPIDQCHGQGACNPANGLCSTPELDDFTPCDDGNSETINDVCMHGVCTGHNSEIITHTPTQEPTTEPTSDPTANPTQDPATQPSANPTAEPSANPTAEPTKTPTTDDLADGQNGETGSSPVAAIAGGVGGAAIVLALGVWCYLKRKTNLERPELEFMGSESNPRRNEDGPLTPGATPLTPGADPETPGALTPGGLNRILLGNTQVTAAGGDSPSVKRINARTETGRMETGRDPLERLELDHPGWKDARDSLNKLNNDGPFYHDGKRWKVGGNGPTNV